jgi:hypothetical protein
MSESQLRRYTTLPYILDILLNNRLTLRDPASWEDKNDSYFLETFKKKRGLESVLALCFAEAPETYQHWKIYSGNTSGVCIEFYKDKLLSHFNPKDGFVRRPVKYKIFDKLRDQSPTIADLPFIKRYAYRGEQEFRIIYPSPDKKIEFKYVTIYPEDIRMITLNPWIDETNFHSIKLIIGNIEGYKGINIRSSTIIGNNEWKMIADNAI